MFLLVAHFRTEPRDQALPGDPVGPRARAALALLVRDGGCQRLEFARATDDAAHFVLVAEFASAAAYRRALSPFEARTILVPWLSTADQAISGVSEVLLSIEGGELSDHDPTVDPSVR